MRNNGTMRAHIRSRIGLKTTGAQGIGGCLPYAQRRYKKRSARSTWEAPKEDDTTASTTAVPVLGILSMVIVVIVVVIMENDVRFFRWLFLFHLRLIEEWAIEVLVRGSRRKPGAKLSL